MIKKLLFIIGILTTLITSTFSQESEGYWDNQRATTKEINIIAGGKSWFRTDEFPVGTTEVVYRITVLDDNQKLSNDLVSGLSVIPDPTGLSQGSAGIISLLSKFSGSDKCKFTIFSSYNDVKNYYDNGNYQSGCYIHPNDINQFSGRLSLSSSNCLQKSPNFLWFGFKSLNMYLNEKIKIEIVPWVDKKASRGWSIDVKNNIIINCKKIESTIKLSDSNKFCQCLVDKLQEKYKFQDFQQMNKTEINNISEYYLKECFKETGELKFINETQRNDALLLSQKGRYGEAINLLLDIINNGEPVQTDYNEIGYYYIFTKQYLKAIKFLKLGEQIDESDLLIKGNLAHAYLLNGNIDEAKEIYLKYKNQNVSEDMSWKEMIKLDFSDFSEAGLPTNDFETINNLLK
jgi:hypothetical protein